MRRLASCVLLAVCACSLDTTEPGFQRPADAVDVALNFCYTDLPNWVAIRNEGQGWQIISRDFRQHNVMAVSSRVVVAYGTTFLSAASSQVKVLFVTADELAKANCGALVGDKTLYANVAGTEASDLVFAEIASASGRTDPCLLRCSFGTPTQVRIDGVSEGPGDLLAHRLATTGDERPHYILRHAVDAPNRSLIASLDFAAPEATVTDRFLLTVDGQVTANAFARFISVRGTTRELGMTSVNTGVGIYMALPQRILAAGDLHRQTVIAPDGRVSAAYVETLGALNMSLGPTMATAAVTALPIPPSSATLRMRAVFASQAEYPDFAAATFYQGAFQNRAVSVVVSRGYLDGTPAQWELEIPEMPFLNPEAQLQPGVATEWHVEAWKSTPALFFGDGGATVGSTLRCAVASPVASLMKRGCRTPLLMGVPEPPAEISASLSP